MNPMLDATPLLARFGGGSHYAAGGSEIGAGFGVSADVDLGTRGSIGGTNTKVAATLLTAGGVLALLKWAGFRFNVGVSR